MRVQKKTTRIASRASCLLMVAFYEPAPPPPYGADVLYVKDSAQSCTSIIIVCEYLKEVREKYVKQYNHNRPSMMKFIELMNTRTQKNGSSL